MTAYATPRRDPSTQSESRSTGRLALAPALGASASDLHSPTVDAPGGFHERHEHVLEQLIGHLADRLASTVAERLIAEIDGRGAEEWLDSRSAAEYLNVHRDTLRKLAAERAIPSEQDGPGCKLYFRRSDLDTWRRSGGRPRHLASTRSHVA